MPNREITKREDLVKMCTVVLIFVLVCLCLVPRPSHLFQRSMQKLLMEYWESIHSKFYLFISVAHCLAAKSCDYHMIPLPTLHCTLLVERLKIWEGLGTATRLVCFMKIKVFA